MKAASPIIIAMSGGVDSSVAAFLLKEQGLPVEGMFMKNWEDDDTDEYCSAQKDLEDAERVCADLGIRLHKVNFSSEYWDRVFERFLHEYQIGRTPNPDIWCNKEIKFKAFLDYALMLGAEKIATGHYARIKPSQEQFLLLRGNDANKDQSYFLYTLEQEQLARSLFPIGDLTKTRVREIANQVGFANHNKKDSTGICFIGERKFKDFLQRYIAPKPGMIINEQGTEIGEHQGLMFYTIGQREGLGIGGRQDSREDPWYVAKKLLATNQLVVVQGQDHPDLYQQHLTCDEVNFISPHKPKQGFSCTAKIRYRTQDQPCQVIPLTQHRYEVSFNEPQWAVTPGQSIVFYQNEICLGGGIIE